MEPTIIYTILVGAFLLLLSVIASRLSSRLGVPALLLFLLIGMLAGSEGPGGVAFDDPLIAMFVGSIALALILFDGGLQAEVDQMDRSLVRSGALLSTIGVLLTAGVVAGFAVLVIGMTPIEGLLLGAVLSSTDAAAVFAVLRGRGLALPQRLRLLIEFESGSNDPTAVFLTVSVISLVQMGPSEPGMLPLLFLYRIVVGGILGWLAGSATTRLLNGIDLEHDGLYAVLTLAAVGATFGLAEVASTSGFMAVYVAGLTMSRRVFVHRTSILRFHEGLAWLMQVIMFLALGLLVFPSHLVAQALPALGISAVLIFAARPLAVFVSLLGSGLSIREKLMVAWVGLRGAAPIILATFPMVAGVAASDTIFNVVFVAVIMSVLVQGPSVGFVARLLGIAVPLVGDAPMPIDVDIPPDIDLSIKRLAIEEGAEADGEKLLAIGGPSRPLVVLIRRQGWLFIPTGNTRLLADDELYVLGSEESVHEMGRVTGRAGVAK